MESQMQCASATAAGPATSHEAHRFNQLLTGVEDLLPVHSDPLVLHVLTLAGATVCTAQMQSSDCVRSLVEIVAREMRIPPSLPSSCLSLIWEGVELIPEQTLQGLPSGAEIQAVRVPSDTCGEFFRVAVRCRPLSAERERLRQEAAGLCESVEIDTASRTVSIYDAQSRRNWSEKHFTFHDVFDEDASQEQVFSAAVAELVESVAKGFSATIFAYGPTGGGKSHTLWGTREEPGLLSRSLKLLDNTCRSGEEVRHSDRYDFSCSVVRLPTIRRLRGRMEDMLQSDPLPEEGLRLRARPSPNPGEDMHVENLTIEPVSHAQDAERLMLEARERHRQMVESGSMLGGRATWLCTVYVTAHRRTETGEEVSRSSRLHFVDLEPSDRRSIRASFGEAPNLNVGCSLMSSLGMVINALSQHARRKAAGDGPNLAKTIHIPYRESDLTYFLRESFGGFARSLFIINTSKEFSEDMLNALRLGVRAQTILKYPKQTAWKSPNASEHAAACD